MYVSYYTTDNIYIYFNDNNDVQTDVFVSLGDNIYVKKT